MFDIGWPELLVLLVVGIVVFGPDRLPEFARQAGRFVRQFRQFTQQARDDIRSELGPEFSDFELTDLDPRRAIRKHLVDAWDEEPAPLDESSWSRRKPRANLLDEGERPPYDSDAT